MVKRVIWGNGQVDEGATWRDVEDSVRSGQWSRYLTRIAFRQAMRRRAAVWAGSRAAAVPVLGRSRRFLAALEAAGLLRMEEDGS